MFDKKEYMKKYQRKYYQEHKEKIKERLYHPVDPSVGTGR